ncbi:hypothetical protein [Intestinibacter sp.]
MVVQNYNELKYFLKNDYFYKLCDREGLLTWAEMPFISVQILKDPTN